MFLRDKKSRQKISDDGNHSCFQNVRTKFVSTTAKQWFCQNVVLMAVFILSTNVNKDETPVGMLLEILDKPWRKQFKLSYTDNIKFVKIHVFSVENLKPLSNLMYHSSNLLLKICHYHLIKTTLPNALEYNFVFIYHLWMFIIFYLSGCKLLFFFNSVLSGVVNFSAVCSFLFVLVVTIFEIGKLFFYSFRGLDSEAEEGSRSSMAFRFPFLGSLDHLVIFFF